MISRDFFNVDGEIGDTIVSSDKNFSIFIQFNKIAKFQSKIVNTIARFA